MHIGGLCSSTYLDQYGGLGQVIRRTILIKMYAKCLSGIKLSKEGSKRCATLTPEAMGGGAKVSFICCLNGWK